VNHVIFDAPCLLDVLVPPILRVCPEFVGNASDPRIRGTRE
jgi:hypothetical protein